MGMFSLGFIVAFVVFVLMPATGVKIKLKRFKPFRWWKGGRWVYHEKDWWPVFPSDAKMMADYADHPGHGYHWTFIGIEKREDYTCAGVGHRWRKWKGKWPYCKRCDIA